MQIETYQPPPASPSPPEPPRKKRTGLVVTLIMAGTFLGTLAVLSWHNLTRPAAQEVATTKPQVIAKAASPTQTPIAPALPVNQVSEQATRNIRGVAECIAPDVLAGDDLEHVIIAMLNKARSAEPAAMMAFEGGTVNPQGVTTVQASGFMGMLNNVQGPLADKARQGFQQGIEDGICKIAAPVFSQEPPPPAS